MAGQGPCTPGFSRGSCGHRLRSRQSRRCSDLASKAATLAGQRARSCAGVVIAISCCVAAMVGSRTEGSPVRSDAAINRVPSGCGFAVGPPVRAQTRSRVTRTGYATRAGPWSWQRTREARRSSIAGRNVTGTVPASPPRSRAVWDGRQPLQPPLRRPGAMRLSWRAKRLRFGRHRVAALPHHCRPQGFPRPPCPSPGNRTRGGGRRHGASDTPRQRER